MNKVTIWGRLGRDPEVNYTQNGLAICKLSVAISERKKVGDSWEDHTEWVRVTIFGKRGESAGQYLMKGSGVAVTGKMRTSKYTDKNGVDKWSTEVVADDISYTDRKSKKGESVKHENQSKQAASQDWNDEDLPF